MDAPIQTTPFRAYTANLTDWLIYGTKVVGRVGTTKPNPAISRNVGKAQDATATMLYSRDMREKEYELKDHLGNVRVVVSDLKLSTSSPVGKGGFRSDSISIANYYAFGMMQPSRIWNANAYRYGFNGQEKVDNIAGAGNHNTAKFGELDVRLNRRWSLDVKPISGVSNYSVFRNSPIWISDAALDTPSVRQAADIAEHVYGPNAVGDYPDLEGDWKQVDLPIKGVVYHDKESGYDAGLYKRTVKGHTEYVFATRGTESWTDVATDILQPFGLSTQYDIAVENAVILKRYFGSKVDLTFVGHSLGGGLAAAGAMATGYYAITFNAAGVSTITKAELSGSFKDFLKNLSTPLFRKIDAYVVQGQALDLLQSYSVDLGVDGNVHEITVSWTSGYYYDITGLSKHTMGAVKNAIENENIP